MTISVVIPTLDEAASIVGAVSSAFDPEAGANPIEVVVVDGGSRDQTVQLAREAGARVVLLSESVSLSSNSSPPSDSPSAHASKDGVSEGRAAAGRARQLRMGTENTKGEVVLFLHADTRLEAGWSTEVERVLQDPGVSGGAFAFRFAERGFAERWIEWWVARRVAILRLPYGDQALFMRRRVLAEMGGVPIVSMMEDLDVVQGIKRAGQLVSLSLSATTSSRRYRANGTLRGVVRTVLLHQVALLGWWLDWDRDRLAARMGR